MLFALSPSSIMLNAKGPTVTNKTTSMSLNNRSSGKRILHRIDVSLCHFFRRRDSASDGLVSELLQYRLELVWRKHAKQLCVNGTQHDAVASHGPQINGESAHQTLAGASSGSKDGPAGKWAMGVCSTGQGE